MTSVTGEANAHTQTGTCTTGNGEMTKKMGEALSIQYDDGDKEDDVFQNLQQTLRCFMYMVKLII